MDLRMLDYSMLCQEAVKERDQRHQSDTDPSCKRPRAATERPRGHTQLRRHPPFSRRYLWLWWCYVSFSPYRASPNMDSPDTSPVEDEPLPDLSHDSLDKADLEQHRRMTLLWLPYKHRLGQGVRLRLERWLADSSRDGWRFWRHQDRLSHYKEQDSSQVGTLHPVRRPLWQEDQCKGRKPLYLAWTWYRCVEFFQNVPRIPEGSPSSPELSPNPTTTSYYHPVRQACLRYCWSSTQDQIRIQVCPYLYVLCH